MITSKNQDIMRMKKTTKILTGFFAVTLVLTFFLPVMIRKERPADDSDLYKDIIMTPDGEPEVMTVAPFKVIDKIMVDPSFDYSFAHVCPFTVRVEENDNVKEPHITVSPYWKGNLEVSVEEDVLKIYVNMKRAAPDPQTYYMNILTPDNSNISVSVAVPPRMLELIKASSTYLQLNNFKDASLSVELQRTCLTTENCSFSILNVEDEFAKY